MLQTSKNYKTQTVEDIFSISEELQNIIQEDMEKKMYMLTVILKKYKTYIEISIKKLKYSRQSTKGNNRRTKYKTKKFSYIIPMKYCQNQVGLKYQNLYLSKTK